MVPSNPQSLPLLKQFNAFGGVRIASDHISEANDLIDSPQCNLLQRRL
jgi:hypothetical protein